MKTLFVLKLSQKCAGASADLKGLMLYSGHILGTLFKQ